MDFKFSKGTDEQEMREVPADKKNQNAKLVLLLLLVGGFSYVYFFTGLIKPQDAPKPAETPVAPVVKMPLPASTSDQKAAGAAPASSAAPATPAVPAVPAAPVSQAKAAPAKTEKTVPVPVAAPPAKPVSPAASKEEQKKLAAKSTDRKALPPAAEKKDQKTVAVKSDDKKTAESKKQPVPVKNETAKTPAPSKTVKKDNAAKAVAAKESTAVASGSWSVVVGQYSIEEALSADIGRVRKAGLEPVVKTGSRKKAAMNRLFLGEFVSKSEAQAALAKLKLRTSDAFLIESSGKYSVYAGSYLLDARAASEKERLGTAGFTVSIRHSEVAIPTQTLSVGPFADKKAAEAALAKLKSTGVKALLSSQ